MRLDLNRLAELSRDLQATAADLADLRGAVQAGGAALAWQSPAARAFQSALHELLNQLVHAGCRVAELARTLRQHHDRAAERAAELASALNHCSPLGLVAAPLAVGAERLLRLA